MWGMCFDVGGLDLDVPSPPFPFTASPAIALSLKLRRATSSYQECDIRGDARLCTLLVDKCLRVVRARSCFFGTRSLRGRDPLSALGSRLLGRRRVCVCAHASRRWSSSPGRVVQIGSLLVGAAARVVTTNHPPLFILH